MQSAEYRNIYDNEESHFYYASLNRLVLDLLVREGLSRNSRILDAGCGTGGLLQKLSKDYLAEGVDISPEALRFCKARRVKTQIASLEKLPFKSNTFGAVVSIDVIYHKFVKSDLEAMRELARVLQPDGVMVLRVPAFNFLKNDHDKVVMTRRRYTAQKIGDLALKCGLEIRQISYLNPSLFIGSLLFRHRHGSSVTKLNRVVNWLGSVVLGLENLLVRLGGSWFIGQGVLLVARKRDFDKLRR